MDSSGQPSDAFSDTLNRIPRKPSRQNQQRQQRSSALFEPPAVSHRPRRPDDVPAIPPKPAVPRKPSSLRGQPQTPRAISPRVPSTPASDTDGDSGADVPPPSFQDIRARFEEQGVRPAAPRPPSTRPLSVGVSHVTTRLEQVSLAPPVALSASMPTSTDFVPMSHPTPPKRPSIHKLSSAQSDASGLHTVSRSTTGNSLSSTSSSFSKRSWNSPMAIYNRLSGSQAEPIPRTTTINDTSPRTTLLHDISPPTPASQPSVASSPVDKRVKIIQELLDTERVYQSDMGLLKSIYYTPSLQPGAILSATDVRYLFSNVPAIVDFEKSFVDELSAASEKEPSSLGDVFLRNMDTIDHIYCEYCKRHEDAVLRLQELSSRSDVQFFLQECGEQLHGKTQSWDLGSLLIKPVQRVLKYPLLLKELLLTTPTDHDDYANLAQASSDIEKVADHINEIKRRKDIVERIVNDKKKGEINVVHGLNKKLTRKAQQIRQVTGLSSTEATQDATFDALYQQFEQQQQVVQQLIRDIQAWVRHIKDHFDTLLTFATSLEDVYGAFGGVRVRSMNQIKEFAELASMFSMVMSRELDASVRGYIYGRIDDFLAVFENPTQVINKRAQKLLDFDRVRDIKARGDVPDKALQESADVYSSINAQLTDELPAFLALTSQYLELIVGDLTRVQSKFYQRLAREWTRLTLQFKQPFHLRASNDPALFDPIVQQYQEQMLRYVQHLVDDIAILQPDFASGIQSDSLLDDVSSTSTTQSRQWTR